MSEEKFNYEKILNEAIPFYEKGREGDIQHVKWLYKTIPNFIDDSVDSEILMPVALLHDVGYANVPKNSDSYNLDIRKLHSEEGAKIAKNILEKLNYPNKKIAEIERLILKHDNWAFGDSFKDEPTLLFFQNFDFMWMASKEGFEICRKNMKKEPQEFYEQIEKFQEANIERGTKWYNEKIEKYYEQLMGERKSELK